MLKKLLVLGRGPSLKHCIYDPDADVWCCVSAIRDTQWEKVDKAFAFDYSNLNSVADGEGYMRDCIRFCKDKGIPIVSSFRYADEVYPITAIKRAFAICYTLTTVSYMLALAIYEGYEKITLYGVDQGPEPQYQEGKPYVTFWIGVAVGKDIRIETPCSPLLLQPMWYYPDSVNVLKGITPDKKIKVTIPAGGGRNEPYSEIYPHVK